MRLIHLHLFTLLTALSLVLALAIRAEEVDPHKVSKQFRLNTMIDVSGGFSSFIAAVCCRRGPVYHRPRAHYRLLLHVPRDGHVHHPSPEQGHQLYARHYSQLPVFSGYFPSSALRRPRTPERTLPLTTGPLTQRDGSPSCPHA